MSDCEKQLRDMCERYAKDAREGEMCFWPRDEEHEEEWYQAYSIRYIIDGSGEYLGARLMIAGAVLLFGLTLGKERSRASGVRTSAAFQSGITSILMSIGKRCISA
jgi:hypothetical protein